jgi:hypothetical protein
VVEALCRQATILGRQVSVLRVACVTLWSTNDVGPDYAEEKLEELLDEAASCPNSDVLRDRLPS